MATSRGYLGEDVSNNVAEYEGLAACMQRALEVIPSSGRVLFEVDSKLICRQVQVLGPGKFACRGAQLKPYYLHCVRMGWRLQARNIE